MKPSTVLLFLSVFTSLLVIALGPRQPRIEGSAHWRKVLLDIRWMPPLTLRRTRIALLVMSAALLFMALVPPSTMH